MRTPRKLTALVLMGALTASSVAAVPASAKTFSDVPSTHWAYTVIDEISNETIMVGVGDGLFSPETKLTRAEYTAILFNLAPDKANGHTYEAHLKDVEADAWYAEAAEWGVTHGIIFESDGNFEPNKVITRESMADMTYKYLSKYYPHSYEYDPSDAGYADQDQIDQSCKSSVNVLTHNGLLAGRGNNQFVPEGSLTRAEAAAMGSRLMDVAEKAAAENPGEEQPPTEDPDEEQPPVEEPDNPGEDNPGEDNPSVDPDEPEQPPVDEPDDPADEEPAEDPNDPANWNLDGAPKWFLVGQPKGYITDDQWKALITYYEGKERPDFYPTEIPEGLVGEENAKAYMSNYMKKLYDHMMQEQAQIVLDEDGTASLSAEEKKMVDLVNKARKDVGAGELKVSAALCEAASVRAEEIGQKASRLSYNEFYSKESSFFHSRLDGSASYTILGETSLKPFTDENNNGTADKDYVSFAENLTKKYGGGSISASDAFNSLFNSSSHYNAMVKPTYTHIGVAADFSTKTPVWVQIFSNVYE